MLILPDSKTELAEHPWASVDELLSTAEYRYGIRWFEWFDKMTWWETDIEGDVVTVSHYEQYWNYPGSYAQDPPMGQLVEQVHDYIEIQGEPTPEKGWVNTYYGYGTASAKVMGEDKLDFLTAARRAERKIAPADHLAYVKSYSNNSWPDGNGRVKWGTTGNLQTRWPGRLDEILAYDRYAAYWTEAYYLTLLEPWKVEAFNEVYELNPLAAELILDMDELLLREAKNCRQVQYLRSFPRWKRSVV